MKSLLFPIALTAVVAFVMIRSLPSYGPLHTEEAQVTFAYAPARTWHSVSPSHVTETRLAVLRGHNLHVTLDGDQGDDAWKRFNPGQSVVVQYRKKLAVRSGKTNVIGFKVERILSEAEANEDHRYVAGAIVRMESVPESALQCWMLVEKRATDKAFDDAVAGKIPQELKGYGITTPSDIPDVWNTKHDGPSAPGKEQK